MRRVVSVSRFVAGAPRVLLDELIRWLGGAMLIRAAPRVVYVYSGPRAGRISAR
jgi:hypothetical protein